MALYFKTNDPSKLLNEFEKAIKEGRVITWSRDDDGDFTHTPDQWKNKAWLRPRIENDQLKLIIIKPKTTTISTEVYAIYHGRFIESMLFHCDKFFSDGVASAFPTNGDIVQ
jgi:hypothetical protein